MTSHQSRSDPASWISLLQSRYVQKTMYEGPLANTAIACLESPKGSSRVNIGRRFHGPHPLSVAMACLKALIMLLGRTVYGRRVVQL